MRPEKVEWLQRTPIAHRGLHDATSPENSLAAFDKAVASGVGIELDVQLSKDGQVVVFHDDTLERMTAAQGDVASRTAEELGVLALEGGGGETIPTLRKVLDRVAGRVPLLIELKSRDRRTELPRRVVADLAGYRGPVALQSFNPAVVRDLKTLAPHIPAGLLAKKFTADDRVSPFLRWALTRLVFAGLAKPDFIAYRGEDIGPRLAARIRKSGRPLLLWTIKDEAGRRKARDLGANIIFEGGEGASTDGHLH